MITATSQALGGVETVTHLLKTTFEQANHSVDILSAENIPQKKSWAVRFWGPPYLTAKKYAAEVKHYDVIISNGEFGWGITHPRAVALFHGSYYGLYKYLKSYLSIKEQLHLKKQAWIQKKGAANKTVVAVSPFTKALLEEQGISVQAVISNGVDVTRFCPKNTPKNKRYLFVANQYSPMDYYTKGFDLIEKLASLGLRIDAVSNVYPGKNISWMQSVPHAAMHTIYPGYRALISPSRFEANALAPLEAMACGLPVVMGPVGLASTVNQSLPECVVDNGDPQAYWKRLQVIEHSWKALSLRCRQFAEEHSHEMFGNRWKKLLNSLRRL